MATDNTKTPAIEDVTFKMDDMTSIVTTSVQENLYKQVLNSVYGANFSENHDEEEWVWVDGYKGTTADMKAHGDFQYKLNEMYSMDEDAKIMVCHSGFHLCLDLEDVFSYYDIEAGNRFFKVRALVRKKDISLVKEGDRYPGYSPLSFGYYAPVRDSKLAAKKIILERELTLDEIFYQDKYADWTTEEKQQALKEKVSVVVDKYNLRKLIEAGYSEVFSKWVVGAAKTKIALAVASLPDVSMDMKVFAIMYDRKD